MNIQANSSISQAKNTTLVQMAHKKKEEDVTPAAVSGMDMALLAIMDCYQITHQSDAIQVQGLQANASLQNNLINEMAQQKTTTLSETQMEKKVPIYKTKIDVGGNIDYIITGYKEEKAPVSAAVLDQMQWKNQLSAEIQGIIQAKLNLQGQNAQVLTSNISATTDNAEQTHQEFTAMLSNLTQLGNQTSRMS